jgi:hypothetical protein
MKGMMRILRADGTNEDIDYVTKLATREEIEEELGGPAVRVKQFTRYKGEACAVFCLPQHPSLAFNAQATQAWQKATADELAEVLAGTVVILTGTPEFVGSV